MQGYFKARNNDVVVFDAFYRENPCGGGYAIACGLEQVIDYIKNLQFSADDIRYLQSLNMFDEDFLKYLSSFRFSGSIYAIPEGTVNTGIRSLCTAQTEFHDTVVLCCIADTGCFCGDEALMVQNI